jgi:Cu+-exporting ATPase
MAAAAETGERVRLELEGMTYASCAARIERKLNKLEGVEAAGNFATEEATVTFDPGRVSLVELVGAVEAAGYGASLPGTTREGEDTTRALRLRLLVAAVLTAPLAALAMIPPLQFGGWEWLAFLLATPVVLWSGWRFHRAAAQPAPRGGDDGYAGLHRHARRLGVVARGVARLPRRSPTSRSGR